MNDSTGFDSPVWLFSMQVAVLTFAALGGGLAMLMPELQRFAVIEHQWMTSEQFISAFTIGQAAPGPNFIYITLIGWRLGGFWGALLTTLAVVVPPGLVVYSILRFGEARVSPRFQKALRNGLAPVSTGLILAFGWVLCSHVDLNWRAMLVTLVTIVVIMRTRINPVWLVLVGAVLGVTGVVL